MTGGRQSEAGFTLVEVLVAIAALGIIMLPLTAGLGIGYRSLDQTSNRLTSSSDAEFLTIYLPTDIKSADAGATTGITCTGVAIGAYPKLQLTSNPYTLAGVTTTVVVVYWIKSVTGGFQLIRSECGATPKSLVVARNLVDTTAVTVATVDVTRGYSLKVTEKNATSDTSSPYQFTVSGRFRTKTPS